MSRSDCKPVGERGFGIMLRVYRLKVEGLPGNDLLIKGLAVGGVS